MTDFNNNNKYVLQAPKTYEQFVLEEHNLTNQQELYPDLICEDIGSSKGYGPCTSYYCPHTKEQLQQQLREAEAAKERLRQQAENDIYHLFGECERVHHAWGDYKIEVEEQMSQRRAGKKVQGIIGKVIKAVTAEVPGVSETYDMMVEAGNKIIDSIKSDDLESKRDEAYERYYRVIDWFYSNMGRYRG